MSLLSRKTLSQQTVAVTLQGRPASRYHYFSTPILLPHSTRKFAIRSYSNAALQQRQSTETPVTWPAAGPSVWPPSPLKTTKPPLVNDELDHFAALMESRTTASFSWTPPKPTWSSTAAKSPPVTAATAKLASFRPRKRNQRGSLANSAAEVPLMQEEEDFDVSFPINDEVPEIQSPRFDWRMRAVSRLPAEKAEQWFKQKRKWRFKPGLAQAGEGEPHYEEIQNYTSKFLPLIHLEQLASDAVLKERVEEWPEARLIEEGYRITGLGGFWQKATFFGRPVAVLALGPGEKFGWNRLERGHHIQLSAPSQDAAKCEPLQGSIIEISDTKMKVTFNEKFDLEHYSQLDLWSSDIAVQRMIEAVRSFNVDLSSPTAASSGSGRREAILQGTYLRDALLRGFTPDQTEVPNERSPSLITEPGAFSENQMIQSWAERHIKSSPITIPGDPVLKDLNESQVKAMALMIGNKVSLIQGPPGTGKTRTIAETTKLLKAHFQVPHPTLICTYTNVAVDNLIEALVAAGVTPLRVASPGKVKESIAEYSLEARMEAHPLKGELDELNAELVKLHEKREEVQRRLKDAVMSGSAKAPKEKGKLEKIEAMLKRKDSAVNAVRSKMYHEIVHSADVVCTTCISAASVMLNIVDFPVVFMDEASMCMEPASLIPVMKGCQHLALIGDHQQLPPIITSPEALQGGLGVSLFERLTNEGVVPTVMLDQQYRMHPDISSFPSKEFYDGTLRDGVVDSNGQVDKRLSPPKSKYLQAVASASEDTVASNVPSMVFVHHSGGENKRDKSRVNETEAKIVCDIIEDLLRQNPTLRGESIGVIAPYAAQITYLGRLLQADSALHQRFVESLGSFRADETAAIEVKTVDGFEGREKEVIIFSTVRSNATGYIGFLADRRRLNVGLTRAKKALFVVGNSRTLRAGRVGHVEGAGIAAAKEGAGAKNVKFDIAVDIAAEAALDPKTQVSKSAVEGGKPVVTRHKAGGIWSRYLSWLGERGLIYDWASKKLLS